MNDIKYVGVRVVSLMYYTDAPGPPIMDICGISYATSTPCCRSGFSLRSEIGREYAEPPEPLPSRAVASMPALEVSVLGIGWCPGGRDGRRTSS